MRLWRKKKPAAFYGPCPEPGLYRCSGCGWYFINFGHDWWQGAIYPEGLSPRPDSKLWTGQSLIWEDLEEAYADCAARLEKVV